QLKITTIQSGLSTAGTATLTMTVGSGKTISTLNLSGVTLASSQDEIFGAMRDAVNNDTDLKAAGVVAGINSAGQVVIRNDTGADLGVQFLTSNNASTIVLSVVGTDVSSTAQNITADGTAGDATDAVRVGGQMSIYLADGYTASSSQTAVNSYFNASASAQVTAAATNVGIDDVVTNTVPSNYVSANGALVGKAIAPHNGAAANLTNSYSAQTLTIRDASGAKLAGGDSIVVAAGAAVDTVVSTLNNLAGVKASASAELNVTSYAATGLATTTDISITITSGSTSANLVLTGITGTSSEMDVFKALRDAVNADTTLAGAKVTASIDSSGYVSIKNADGKNLSILMSSGSANSLAVITVRGTDAAGTVQTLTAGGAANTGGGTTVGGTLNVTLADGYTFSSNATKTNSYFDANANASAATVVSGVNFGTRTDAQTLTITGTSAASVAVAKDAAAAEIAQLVNGQTSITGVTATARTQATLSDISTAGTVSFSLYGDNGTAANISALVTG
ncbi:MAG: hypothetical protein AAB131_20715, partial [Actinomycetota bacterium]